MSEQLSLLGDVEAPPGYKLDNVANPAGVAGYSLFFAIFPGEEDAQRISQLVESVRKTRGLKGRPFLAERLHLSLQAVEESSTPPSQLVVAAACSAAAHVICPPLAIAFDRAALFDNKKAACVFHCDKDSAARIAPLRKQLGAALREVGLHPVASSTPHMTMLYDDPQRAFDAPIEPVTWTATRFVLILSHLGASHHQWIKEWPLAGRISS